MKRSVLIFKDIELKARDVSGGVRSKVAIKGKAKSQLRTRVFHMSDMILSGNVDKLSRSSCLFLHYRLTEVKNRHGSDSASNSKSLFACDFESYSISRCIKISFSGVYESKVEIKIYFPLAIPPLQTHSHTNSHGFFIFPSVILINAHNKNAM